MDKETAIVPTMKINAGVIDIVVVRKGEGQDTWVIKQFASGIGNPRANVRLDNESIVTEAKLLEIIADAAIYNMHTDKNQSASRMPERKKPHAEIRLAQIRVAHHRSLLQQHSAI